MPEEKEDSDSNDQESERGKGIGASRGPWNQTNRGHNCSLSSGSYSDEYPEESQLTDDGESHLVNKMR